MAPNETKLDKRRVALLVMDMQKDIVARFGKDPELLDRLKDAIAAARSAGIKVIYVSVLVRESGPEISARNLQYSAIAKAGHFVDSNPASQIHPAIAPLPGDTLVIKRRVSAFSASDLDLVLRANDIDTLVLTGIATSGVVLSTLRQAADLDYGLFVLSDGVSDLDEEINRVLLTKIYPRQATVLTIAEWKKQL